MRLPAPLHAWPRTPARAIALQRALAARVSRLPPQAPIRVVAGLDCAISVDGTRCLGGVVLWDLQRHLVIEQAVARRRLTFPYVPGLLSFRETPVLLVALRRLRRRPDALLCDAHGYAHPRRFGLACHIGVLTGIPTAGCAKSRLVGTHLEPGRSRGARVPLMDEGEVIGAVLRTRSDVRPVYVSIGHRMDLDAACRLVLACALRYRLPEPTRLADQLVAQAKRSEPA